MIPRIAIIIMLSLGLSACVGTVVGAVVDTTIEVAKVPFKVGGAVIDVVTGDDFTQQGQGANGKSKRSDIDVWKSEQQGIH